MRDSSFSKHVAMIVTKREDIAPENFWKSGNSGKAIRNLSPLLMLITQCWKNVINMNSTLNSYK